MTHSPTIGVELAEHPTVEVVLLGGRLFKHSVVAVGAATIEAIITVCHRVSVQREVRSHDRPDGLLSMRARVTTPSRWGRVGTPDEIAKAVVFLASDDGCFVKAIELFVDGGQAQV